MTGRVVRVLPDVSAIDKTFDYTVPSAVDGDVRVGSLVRVELHGRRVGAWVVAEGVEPPAGIELRPLAKVTGWGPSPEMVELSAWAAWRWAGARAPLLRSASPPSAIRALPRSVRSPTDGAPGDELAAAAFARSPALVRLGPAADRMGLVGAALALGPALILVPSSVDASNLAARLVRAGRSVALAPRDWARAAGGVDAVVGTRGAAWASVPDLRAVLVLDAHDEGYVEERSPAWSAWRVALERARRAAVPFVASSPCPTLELLAELALVEPERARERAGWAATEIVDRRAEDPRTGLFSSRVVAVLRSGDRVLCVLNRKGRARLLVCRTCGEVARCERCDGAVEQVASGELQCRRCALIRPALCEACGAQRLKVLRVGVSRAREELEALAGRPVAEVTAETQDLPEAPVLVGTEALLHRVRQADAVVFLDFDQELLAPRFRAGEQALALLARASRIVGGRAGGRVVVQTRVPDSAVLAAAVRGDPSVLTSAEAPVRAGLGLPPEGAIAVLTGPGAAALAESLRRAPVAVTGGPDTGFLVRADDHVALCDALAAIPRPAVRVRVDVDAVRA